MNTLSLRLYRRFLRLSEVSGKARLEALVRRRLERPRGIDVDNDLRLLIDPLEWTQRSLLKDGHSEPMTTRLFAELLKPGSIYIDVGCHVGYHTLVARRCVGRSGRVIALDPQPYNCNRTLENWRLNGFDNLTIYVAAAGEHEGQTTLADQPATDRAKLSLLDDTVSAAAIRFCVPVRRLDGILEREAVGQSALLKIDTEGYELEVLKGLGNALHRIDNIVFELLPGARGSSKTAELLSILENEKFVINTVAGGAWDRRAHLPESNVWASRTS